MRNLLPIFFFLFCFNLFAIKPEAPALSQYQIDIVHGSLDFSIKHMMISSVKGTFRKWDGQFMFSKSTGALAEVRINVDVASIDTKEQKRDDHLRSPDFFDVEKFPKMEFVSKKVVMKGKKPVKVLGDLTIHGITKPATIKLEYLGSTKSMTGAELLAFKGSTTISRKEFALNWNKTLEMGGFVIGDEVKITFDFEAGPTNK